MTHTLSSAVTHQVSRFTSHYHVYSPTVTFQVPLPQPRPTFQVPLSQSKSHCHTTPGPTFPVPVQIPLSRSKPHRHSISPSVTFQVPSSHYSNTSPTVTFQVPYTKSRASAVKVPLSHSKSHARSPTPGQVSLPHSKPQYHTPQSHCHTQSPTCHTPSPTPKQVSLPPQVPLSHSKSHARTGLIYTLRVSISHLKSYCHTPKSHVRTGPTPSVPLTDRLTPTRTTGCCWQDDRTRIMIRV